MRAIALSAFALLSLGAAHAQVSPTEQFVPIGRTPAESVMEGELVSAAALPQSVAQPQAATTGATTAFTMVTRGAERTYLIGPRTRIYLDRSIEGEHNTMGGVADLRAGRTIETFVPDFASRLALWIKVRPE